jgi:hypothetical protein
MACHLQLSNRFLMASDVALDLLHVVLHEPFCLRRLMEIDQLYELLEKATDGSGQVTREPDQPHQVCQA